MDDAPKTASLVFGDVLEDPAPSERALLDIVHLHAFTSALTTARTGHQVFLAVLHEAVAHLDVRGAYLGWIADEVRLETVAIRGYAPGLAARFRRISLDGGPGIAEVMRTAEPLWLPDPKAIAAMSDEIAEIARTAGDVAYVGLPLLIDGRPRGVLGLSFTTAQRFCGQVQRYLTSVAGQAAQALERVRADEAERRAWAETERIAREQAETAALLEVILDSAPVGIGYWDREFRWRRINRALAAMNGLPPEAHLGRRPKEVVPEVEDLEQIEAAWARIVRTGQPELDVEVSGRTPALPGRVRHWVESWYPVRVGEEVVGVGAVVREVTEEKAAEAFRRQVLGVVGHDLRSPLMAVRMGVDTLNGTDLDPLQRRVLARMENATRRMAEMADALLDYSRFTAGEPVQLCRRPTDLAELCSQLVTEAQAGLPKEAVAYEPRGECRGFWDPGRLAQVISNLLTNALQHGPPDQCITLRTEVVGHEAVLSVHNHGAPIPAAGLHRIFAPFRRGSDAAPGGQGLGLFIVQEIVSAHGGTVEVRSTEAEGTCFEVRLPLGHAPR